jgi:hypothetical protein
MLINSSPLFTLSPIVSYDKQQRHRKDKSLHGSSTEFLTQLLVLLLARQIYLN